MAKASKPYRGGDDLNAVIFIPTNKGSNGRRRKEENLECVTFSYSDRLAALGDVRLACNVGQKRGTIIQQKQWPIQAAPYHSLPRHPTLSAGGPALHTEAGLEVCL
jgi:hypothetical protein